MSKDKNKDEYAASRMIVVESAIESLKIQHLTVDELRPCHGVAPIYLYDSAIVNHTHLLATSVLCFHIRYFRHSIEPDELSNMLALLRETQAIWHSSRNSSVEARRVADALSIILDRLGENGFALSPTPVSQVDKGTSWPVMHLLP
jgi:hypothetical protein